MTGEPERPAGRVEHRANPSGQPADRVEQPADRVERGVRRVRELVAEACARAGRDPGEVRLVAVTKGRPPEAVRWAAAAGVADFGENYVRGLEAKRVAAPDATWHFVGRLQRNKVHRVLDAARWIQTLEPGRAADRLAALAGERGLKVPCLVEVDFTASRVGVPPEDLPRLVDSLASLPGIDLRGLMTVAPLGQPPRPFFARLRQLRDGLAEDHPGLRELSMGMSADLQDAVEEGATMVRVGAAIFGPRPRP